MKIRYQDIAALQALGYTEIEARFLYIVATHTFIKTRLILLEFILANPRYDYLETEHDKLRYFCEQLKMPKSCLPTKAYLGSSRTEPTLRYFVDKYPLFLDTSQGPSSPVVTFSYVDPGYAGLAGFANHLNAYDPLFRCLAAFRFVYIANSTVHFTQAEERFSTLVQSPLEADASTELLRYFRLRKAWESKRYGLFSNAEIEWLNEATCRFRGERFESLYSLWLSGQINDETVPHEFTQLNPQKQVHFATYLVNRNRSWQRTAANQQKCASAPHFRAKDFSLQPCAEANFAERNDLPHKEKARKDAAKFG